MRIPTLVGLKTERERFAGAVRTWSCEGMMGDGKALQLGTSHELGQNFARAFDIQYSDDQGARSYVYQTSWGASTRLIGGLIMVHGDDFGLRLPPALAPSQVVVMVVRADETTDRASSAIADQLRSAGLRVRVDDQTGTSFGRRAIDWERKGVPVRVEIGPRDLAQDQAVVVSRYDRSKRSVGLSSLTAEVLSTLERTAEALHAEALAFRASRTTRVDTLDEAAEAAAEGFAVLPWSVVGESGEDVLGEAGITVRCLQRADGSLPGVSEDSLVAVVGKSY
ncbi:MAG TPA: His/Gly/Thr/Pro-type tRNA ligase C-terminal domain-containing protein [Acidimicrobiales bacterium]|nr:His/Gly/Thr/Pro-type tRNA ligase C-terminal domain-containing protein [Acidimicrobiales bacterium]